jgi:hypothetical protein
MEKKYSPGFTSFRMVIAIASFILLFLILSTCKKESGSRITGSQEDEILTSEELAVLDNMPTTNYTFVDVTLPNGMKLSDYLQQNDPDLYNRISKTKSAFVPKPRAADLQAFEQKNLLIAKLIGWGFVLTNRDIFIYQRQGPRTPAQHGLAYSFGQKYYNVRVTPPAGSQTICTDSLYGLDCSGLIYQLALNSGLTLHSDPINYCNAAFEADTMTWVNAFKYTVYKDLHMDNLGQLDKSKIEVGDLIFWKDSGNRIYHVGIVLLGSNLNEQIIFMSCGCARSCDAQGCINNYSEDRGPRQASLADRFPSRYVVLRIKANMFPYHQFMMGMYCHAVYSKAGGEDVSWYSRTWGSMPCTMVGDKIIGVYKHNINESYNDSLVVKLDPVNHTITYFMARRYITLPPVDGYLHYEFEKVDMIGGPITGNSQNTSFAIHGADFGNHVAVSCLYNTRSWDGTKYVIRDEKLLRLTPDNDASFYIEFAY